MIDKQKEKPKNEQDASQHALMMAIGFDEEDLEANQDTTLSPKQQLYLEQQQHPIPWLHVLGAVIAALFAGILLLSDLVSQQIGIGTIFTLSVVFAFAPSLWDWYSLTHNVKVDRVVGLQGRVRLDLDDKNQYFLQIDDLRFEVNKDIFLAFKNGDPYAIYYAPRSRIILWRNGCGQNETPMMEKSKSKGKPQAVQDEFALMWAIGFTPMDLAANQDGILSEYQRKKFRVLRRKNLMVLLSCVLVATAVLALRQLWVSPVNSLCLLIPILLCGSIALGVIINVYKYHRDVTQNRVDAVQGRINLNIMDKSRYTTYTMNVQNQRWVVEKDVLLAFKNGDPYAIYYAPQQQNHSLGGVAAA